MNLQTRINSSVQKSKNGKGYRNKRPSAKIIGVIKNDSQEGKGELSNYVSSNQQLLFSEKEMESLITKKKPNQDELYGEVII